jgi:CheY-like chemotaxis protein
MDISQLDQVLTNLCLNARDAITGTGTITIETANVTLNDSCRPANPACASGDYVALSVRDDGRGIPAEVQAHLFEPFFTTKELGVGTGLGLPIVYGIVTQNHGAITVTSASGQGTTFCIYLPRQTEAPRDADATAPVTSVKRGAGQTILLVEDESSVLALNQTMLEKLGYHVLAAAAPAAALELFRAQRNDIQLLITDVVMPGMSGTDLAAAILALKPGLPCLFMSGYTGIGGVRENLQEQSANFIQKPFALADLAEKIHAALSATL